MTFCEQMWICLSVSRNRSRTNSGAQQGKVYGVDPGQFTQPYVLFIDLIWEHGCDLLSWMLFSPASFEFFYHHQECRWYNGSINHALRLLNRMGLKLQKINQCWAVPNLTFLLCNAPVLLPQPQTTGIERYTASIHGGSTITPQVSCMRKRQM